MSESHISPTAPMAATPVANEVMQAIAGRRSVRAYKPDPVDRDTILGLLQAAVQAPTAMHEEPWAFAVIQNRALLGEISADALANLDDATRERFSGIIKQDFNVFYDAGTLILICARPTSAFVSADCWLAAENLMLAAHAANLGTCVIGFAVQVLNLPAWKQRLGIAADLDVVVPLIVGVPAGPTPPVPRHKPRIVLWK